MNPRLKAKNRVYTIYIYREREKNTEKRTLTAIQNAYISQERCDFRPTFTAHRTHRFSFYLAFSVGVFFLFHMCLCFPSFVFHGPKRSVVSVITFSSFFCFASVYNFLRIYWRSYALCYSFEI